MASNRMNCPGSQEIPQVFTSSNFTEAWCHMCGRILTTRNDGTIPRHPLRYADFLERMADEVEHATPYTFGSALRRPVTA